MPAKYGDVTLNYGWGQKINLERAMIPGEGFIPREQGIYLTQGAVRELGIQLFKNIQREWEPHIKTGASLQGMSIHMGAMSVEINLVGPFLLVEGGFPAHDISVRDPSSALHPDDGTDFFAKTVHSPGYEGDPFIERAFDDLDYDKVLTDLAEQVFTRIGGNLQMIAESLGGRFSFQSANDPSSMVDEGYMNDSNG